LPPLKGPRELVQINQITEKDSDGNYQPVIVAMKRGIREFFGLDRLPADDPILYGEYATGPNAGLTYRKRLGGFRQASYTIHFAGNVEINEYSFENGTWTESTRQMQSITFGLPKGHSTHEVLSFIEQTVVATNGSENLRKLRTPEGNSYDISEWGESEVPNPNQGSGDPAPAPSPTP
jgi:hypothetical protein